MTVEEAIEIGLKILKEWPFPPLDRLFPKPKENTDGKS